MSVMASRDSQAGAEGSPIRLDHLSLDAWTLCREFVQRMVSDAQAAAVSDHPGRPVPEVDWEPIWRAGEGAPSDEAAMGRIIRAASEAARGIALGAPEPESLPTRSDRVDGELGAGVVSDGSLPDRVDAVDLAAPVTALVEPMADQPEPIPVLQEPPTAVVEPVTAVTEPVSPPEEPVTAVTQPVSAPEEPVTIVVYPPADEKEPITAPVLLASSAVGSVTLDRPDAAATTVVEPFHFVEPEEQTVAVEADGEVAPKRVGQSHQGWTTLFTWMEFVGGFILLFVAWQLWGTAISQHHAQTQLKAEFDAAVRTHHVPKATASGPTLVAASVKVPSPPDGSVVARLQIPAIGLDQYVVAGTSADQLSQGPGHYDGTAMPGQAGNVAIAGHRTTHGAPFNRLGQLVHGDRIILTDLSGQDFTYVVSGTPQAVSPNDVAVLNYFGDDRITLTTCTPEFSAAQRLIVVGQLKEPVATPHTTLASKHVSYHIANSNTASWDWSLLPAIGVELSLLLLLGLSYRRFDFWLGRNGKWFILVPVWTAGLLLLFTSLISFLPDTL